MADFTNVETQQKIKRNTRKHGLIKGQMKYPDTSAGGTEIEELQGKDFKITIIRMLKNEKREQIDH